MAWQTQHIPISRSMRFWVLVRLPAEQIYSQIPRVPSFALTIPQEELLDCFGYSAFGMAGIGIAGHTHAHQVYHWDYGISMIIPDYAHLSVLEDLVLGISNPNFFTALEAIAADGQREMDAAAPTLFPHDIVWPVDGAFISEPDTGPLLSRRTKMEVKQHPERFALVHCPVLVIVSSIHVPQPQRDKIEELAKLYLPCLAYLAPGAPLPTAYFKATLDSSMFDVARYADPAITLLAERGHLNLSADGNVLTVSGEIQQQVRALLVLGAIDAIQDEAVRYAVWTMLYFRLMALLGDASWSQIVSLLPHVHLAVNDSRAAESSLQWLAWRLCALLGLVLAEPSIAELMREDWVGKGDSWDEAVAYLEQALELEKGCLGEENTHDHLACEVHVKLGMIRVGVGEREDALHHLALACDLLEAEIPSDMQRLAQIQTLMTQLRAMD